MIAGSLTLVVTACGTAGTASPGKMAPNQAITGSAARKANPRQVGWMNFKMVRQRFFYFRINLLVCTLPVSMM